MGEPARRRRIPWGSLLLGIALLAVAAIALIAIPAATVSPHGQLRPTPGQISLPPTPTAIRPGATVSVTATPRARTTATPGH
jgi:hypothetical protein